MPSPATLEWLRWLLTAFGFWLVVSTRPLWWNAGEFPQVPWFGWACQIPNQVDAVLLLIAGVALIGVGCSAANSRTGQLSLVCFAASLGGLLLLDQHRCQPWAYQWLIVALILVSARPAFATGLLRLLTISIYIHSAISKCDWSFCHGLGHEFVRALSFQITGQQELPDLGWWPLIFPLGELLIAVGLIFPGSRRWTLYLATAMHLLLMQILGPWGLRHSAGVLIWNLFFILQNWVLFGGQSATRNVVSDEAACSADRRTAGDTFAMILLSWVVLWPLTEPWQMCDLWPSWGLYAQHGERMSFRVTADAYRQLPPDWRSAAVPATADEEPQEWVLRPQDVSLQLTRAPVYPQNRFVVGATLAVLRQSGVKNDQVRATWYRPANRWNGERQSLELNSLKEIEQAASDCWWNTQSRRSQ